MLGSPLMRSNAWPGSLLHSCRGVSLKTTSQRACMEVGPSCVMVSSSKHLRRMRNISIHEAVLVQSWSRKPLHGQYRRLTEKPPVDMKETYRRLKPLNLPAATEGLVVAAQDQSQCYERNILHPNVSPTCRLCSVDMKTVDHIVAYCSALAPTTQ